MAHPPSPDRGTTTAAPARRRVRRAHWGPWLLPFLAAGLLVLAAVAAVAAYEFLYFDKIYPGVQVAGINVGGMTLAEAGAAVDEALTPYPGLPVVLEYGDRRWALSPRDLGVAVDGPASATEAYNVGRKGIAMSAGLSLRDWQAYWQAQWNGLVLDLFYQWHALRSGLSVDPVIRFDEGAVDYQLMRIARDVDLAPQEAALSVSGLEVIATAGKDGRRVDLAATRAALADAARSGQPGTVPLVVEERRPVVTSVDAAAAQARTLLSQPLALVVQGAEATQRFAVDRASLRQWLQIAPVARPDGSVELRVQIDRALVDAYLKQIASEIDRPVQEATLDFDPETKQVSVVTASRSGQKLDQEAAAAAIESALSGEQREIALPVAILQPTVDSNKVAEMGIVELVGEGSTNFAGSSSGRVKNIVNAASKFNNVVLAPDEVFSFNKHVGDITAANGFVDSLIISGDRTEVGVGGGVCQVSTTAFQAAARSGFPIVERWAHSYVVGYYGKPGLDATIYTPSVDFRFKNDTGHYVLIKTEVDTDASRVTFRYYGTKPARTVEISDPQITNVTPPDKPIYREDKALPAGTIKQVDWANNGQDVLVVRTIRNADGSATEDRFVSKYQSWRAAFAYGPGTTLPDGALDSQPNG